MHDDGQRRQALAGLTRRHFFGRSSLGIGTAALASLWAAELRGSEAQGSGATAAAADTFHHRPRAKRIVYLFMSGGPSQIELFDRKPQLNRDHGLELPDSVRRGQRLTGMSGHQATLPIAGSKFKFKQHGRSGTWVSELLPHTAAVADELCVVKSLYTEAINHDPAITFIQTGSQIAGRPSLGAWLDYGLGSSNHNLPSFCVLVTKNKGGQPLYARLWGSGFLPANHQGVQFRAGPDPVLYLSNPAGLSRDSRRQMLERLNELHRLEFERRLDPLIEARIEQSEMAFRMQTSVPQLTDLSSESESTFQLYG
ncbi:MAG: DUF1501 domain-containing protein, partial [Planctomycetales bacterium]|nr:DUF1501 domain-containing protein [Planctomycetales bacterium]